LAVGRTGAAAADRSALRLGIGAALRANYANRTGQSGVAGWIGPQPIAIRRRLIQGGPLWTHPELGDTVPLRPMREDDIDAVAAAILSPPEPTFPTGNQIIALLYRVNILTVISYNLD
jgi:hypothetical protein